MVSYKNEQKTSRLVLHEGRIKFEPSEPLLHILIKLDNFMEFCAKYNLNMDLTVNRTYL
jgi:hypothetical protein